jgi:hypothetical protein
MTDDEWFKKRLAQLTDPKHMSEQAILDRENWKFGSKRLFWWDGYWQWPTHWPAIILLPKLEVSFETKNNGEGLRLGIRVPRDFRLNVRFSFLRLACGVSIFTGIRLVN